MSMKADILKALMSAGTPMSRRELQAALQTDESKQLSVCLSNMTYVDQLICEPDDEGVRRYSPGPKNGTVRMDDGEVLPSPPAAPAAKRTQRNQERKAPPVKRSRTRRSTPRTGIILAAASSKQPPDRAATARDLAAGLVGNVATSVELLSTVLDNELAETTPCIAAALAQLKAAVSLCEISLRAPGGGA